MRSRVGAVPGKLASSEVPGLGNIYWSRKSKMRKMLRVNRGGGKTHDRHKSQIHYILY